MLENVGQNGVERLRCKFENLCGKFLSYVKNHPVAFSSEMVGGITGLSFVSWWASILRLGEYFDSNNLLDKSDVGQITKGVIEFSKTKDNYSVPTAGARMLWDVITRKSAVERLESSFRRRNRSTKGACWDVALALDHVLMKTGCKHHYIVGWLLTCGIPHTFNLFHIEGKGWYMFDPLDGVGVFINGRYDVCFIAYSQIKDGVSMWISNDYLGNDVLKFTINNPEDFVDKFKGKLKKYEGNSEKERAGNYLREKCKREGYYLDKSLPEGNEKKWMVYYGANKFVGKKEIGRTWMG